MTILGSKLTRGLAVGALAISSLISMAPATQAIPLSPASYPSGTYANVPVSALTGWTECWSSVYATSENMSTVLDGCTGDYLLLAGGPAGGDTFDVAAAGPRSAVLSITARHATTAANGSYWYYTGGSMGFAPIAQIYQNSADVIDANWGNQYVSEDRDTGAWRLSWHTIGNYGETPTAIDGGWRSGAHTSLNSSSEYIRKIYTADTVNPALGWGSAIKWTPMSHQPQLVVDALNVNVAMGEPVPADVRVLGLLGTDKVTDIVLEYEGTDIWGVHYGPSTTPPTLAGTYSITVKSYVFTAANAAQYFQSKHGATLVIRWKALPITDPKLAAPAVNVDAPGTLVYGDNGATFTGTGWGLGLIGAPRASIGGFLITDAGTVFTVTGTGYRPWSPVRIWFMSDPVELGKVYTDATGAFTTTVTVPTGATGNHTLQVNGYSATNQVRSSNVALFVGTTRSLSDKFLFAKGSSALSSAATAKIQMMMNSIPVKPWRIHITLTTSALSLTGANARITQERVDNIANRLASSLKAAGVDVVVESTIWYQPGLYPRWEKQARWVFVDLNW